jgi:hypothetical protein
VKQYVQTDLEADRQVANTLAELIIGGSLASVDIVNAQARTSNAAPRPRPAKPQSGEDTAA